MMSLLACNSSTDNQKVYYYYDLEGFIGSLESTLSEEEPTVSKKWSFNSKSEVKETNEIDWLKELKAFKESDINKSSYSNSFDSVRTAHQVVYTLKEGETIPVKELSIQSDHSGQPEEIRSRKESENYFFTTSSEAQMILKEGKLKEYTILSIQKLLWFKPDTSKVTGLVKAN